MIKRTLKQIEKMVNGTGLAEKYFDMTAQGVSIDTRKMEKGNVYVPIQGERFDGHSFVEKAIESGAVATLWKKRCTKPTCEYASYLCGRYIGSIANVS